MQRSRAGSPPITPPPGTHQSSNRRRDRSRNRGYSLPREKSRKREVTLLLCVFHSSGHNWATKSVRFDPNRINDQELWFDIRDTFRMDLQKPWRRIFGFKKVKSIVPIGYTPNGVPERTDPKNFPDSKTFMHAYHHPDNLRPGHLWVDWFADLDSSDQRPNGLEFVEGLWADKLAAVAILATIGIVTASIVWCVKGGDLQTVFTVMSFVLSLVAAQIALAALYYQITLSGSGV